MNNLYKKEEASISLNIKDHLLKKLSREQQIPLHIVKAVIENQFKTAEKAINEVNSIELAGFGKFFISEKRTLIRIKNYKMGIERYKTMLEDPTVVLTTMKREGIITRIEELEKGIIYLSKKADGFTKN